MPLFIFFVCYQILQLILFPFFLTYLIIRWAKKKNVFGNLWQRCGFVPTTKKSDTKIIWIHAVSVGEVLSVQNLINQIKQQIKNSTCYLTTGTITGKKIAQEQLNCDYVSFLPFDFLISIFIAFKRIKPSSIIVIEAETWPNFLILSKWLKIPTYSLNARISARSKKRYEKLKFIFKPLLNIFKIIFVQSYEDKENFEQLGINENKLIVLGNIKTLNVLVKKQECCDDLLNYKNQIYKTLLVGSLHPGELDIYLNLFRQLKQNFENLKLIIAPRHFNWKTELIDKVKTTGFNYYVWEKPTSQNYTAFVSQILKNYDILLVCKLGELFNLYPFSNIFYLGGTFVPVGGHNLLEPAVWAKPSIIGPYYCNCKDIADKLEKINGLIKVKNQNELLIQTQKLLNDNNLTLQIGGSAFKWLENEAVSVQKKLEILIQKIS